jgi:hypothetical protein
MMIVLREDAHLIKAWGVPLGYLPNPACGRTKEVPCRPPLMQQLPVED